MAVSFDGDNWPIGVAVAVTGNLIDATGWTLEKRAHKKLQKKMKPSEEESISYLKNPRWWLGFITHASGTLLFSLAQGLGDQALIMPLQSVTLVFNTIFARLFLDEKLNWLQIIATALIIVGCAVAIAFGPKSASATYNAEELAAMFENTAFLVFSMLLSLSAVAVYILFKCGVIRQKKIVMVS